MENGAVLAIYDIRGIQDFIFRSNRIREIIGASKIVETVMESALDAFFAEKGIPPEAAQWFETQRDARGRTVRRAKPFTFGDGRTDAEVLYHGGGNMVVAYASQGLAQEAYRHLARTVLHETYSLNLCAAMVPMSGSYRQDYRALQATLDRLKARGQSMAPAGPGPLSIREASTGFAIATRQGEDRMSVETSLKQKRYAQMLRDGEQVPYALLLDDMVAGLDNSYLGIVHIDGNGMGEAIARRLSGMHTYAEAVAAMRALSLRISDVFTRDAFTQMIGMLPGPQEPAQKLPLRPIILAGDDITFVCRADLALPLTSAFLRCVSQSALCDRAADASDGSASPAEAVPDLVQYGFSACAGIAYAHSHHPFSKTYLLAEELCQSAKAKAKAAENLVDGRVGSYVDFHICYGGVLDGLEAMRETQYTNQQGLPLLRRPICVDESAPPDVYTLTQFTADLVHLGSMPRGWMKRARDAYHMTEGAAGRVFSEAASLPGRAVAQAPPFVSGRATCYDALELLDIAGIEQTAGEEAGA